MAINMDSLIQGYVDWMNPQKQADRDIVKAFTARPIAVEADAIMAGTASFARDLRVAVEAGYLSDDDAVDMIKARKDLGMSMAKFAKAWLKAESGGGTIA